MPRMGFVPNIFACGFSSISANLKNYKIQFTFYLQILRYNCLCKIQMKSFSLTIVKVNGFVEGVSTWFRYFPA